MLKIALTLVSFFVLELANAQVAPDEYFLKSNELGHYLIQCKKSVNLKNEVSHECETIASMTPQRFAEFSQKIERAYLKNDRNGKIAIGTGIFVAAPVGFFSCPLMVAGSGSIGAVFGAAIGAGAGPIGSVVIGGSTVLIGATLGGIGCVAITMYTANTVGGLAKKMLRLLTLDKYVPGTYDLNVKQKSLRNSVVSLESPVTNKASEWYINNFKSFSVVDPQIRQAKFSL